MVIKENEKFLTADSTRFLFALWKIFVNIQCQQKFILKQLKHFLLFMRETIQKALEAKDLSGREQKQSRRI